MRRRKTGCIGRILNILTAALLTLALITAVVIGILLFSPGLREPVQQFLMVQLQGTPIPTPTLIPVAVVPTLTPTPTPERLLPTFTPRIPTATPTPLPTNTRRPTSTPTATPIFPTKTPTRTPTPTATNTPLPTPTGPTPTPSPTLSAFPFTKSDVSPFYLQNFANSAGCTWMGVAGEVLDLNRNPVLPGSYVVHVWGSGIDARLVVGSAPDYGPSGWEQFLFNEPVVRDYNVQLETPNGTAVSQVYRFQTRASCNENLVKFDFVQNH